MSIQAASSDDGVHPNRTNQSAISTWKPLLVFILFTLAITAGGYTVFQHYKKGIKSDKQNELGGIAELKVRQITTWMEERKGDAQALKDDPLFMSAVEGWLQRGAPAGEAGGKLTARLSSMQRAYAAYGYHSISLFDDQAVLRLSSSADEAPATESEKALLLESMRSGQITFSDIHQNIHNTGEEIEIDFAAPLLAGKNGRARTIGAVLFRMDTRRFLFPLIQRWPTPSASAENLIVRRDGDEVVFLNELRHRKNTALVMRLPLTPDLPAAMAAMGQVGLMEGTDYRGIPVVGVLSKVPGTSWSMVSKIDKAEIYAPINQLSNWMLLLMLALVGIGGGIIVYWRKKEITRYKENLDQERLANLLVYLGKNTNDIILLHDDTGMIVDCNDRATEVYGYSAEELFGKSLPLLLTAESAAAFARECEEVGFAGAVKSESMHVKKGGALFPVETCVRSIDIAGEKYYQTIIRDITERKRAEEQLRRSERSLAEAQRLAQLGSWELDLESNVLTWSDESYRIFGIDPEKFGASYEAFLNVVHPEDRDWVNKAYTESVRDKEPYDIVHRLQMQDGRIKYVNEICETYYAEDGKPLRSIGTTHDITERKLAEARLEIEHTRLRTLVQTIPDMIWMKDAEGIFLVCNPQIERFYGAKEADIVGKTDYDFVDAELADWFRLKDREAMAAGKLCVTEEWITWPDNGQRTLLETIKMPMRDGAGKLAGVMGIARDITERKQAEENNSRLRHILDSTLDMIFIFQPDSLRFVYTNKGAIDSIGYSNEELSLMTPPDITPQMPDPEFRKFIAPLIAGKNKMLRFETLHRHKNGTDLQVEVQLQLVQENNGENIFVAIVRDITDRRRAETELKRQKTFMWQVIDSDPNRIFVKDAQGNFLLANRSAAAMHGLAPNEMVGKNQTEIRHTPEEVAEYLKTDRKVIEEKREISLVASYTLPNGKQHWFLTIKKPLIMPNGRLSILGIAVDITEQKLYEIKLALSYRKLQQLSLHLENIRAEERAKIAHNLHDEMGASRVAKIMIIAWLALKMPADMQQLANEMDHLNELVSAAIQTMRQTVTQLNPDRLDNVGLVDAIRDYVKKFQQYTKVECLVILPKDELTLNTNQSTTIFRIIQESLNNVVKHAQASEVHITLKKRGKSLLLTIEDNGIGLNLDEQKKQSFGLLGIRERALMVGGKARIKSQPGKGTKVSASIPLTAGNNPLDAV
ncbi:MAG: PAS domain S-box protein [Sideroxyarcus sp.]|nr:PAS domain S-box protein [Sideroxyarcus sp.]